MAAPRTAVAEKMAGSASQWKQPAGKGLGFYTGEDGYLYCDNLRVDEIRKEVCHSQQRRIIISSSSCGRISTAELEAMSVLLMSALPLKQQHELQEQQ
jgi:hypothetical protein